MHPDTELYLDALRFRLGWEFSAWRDSQRLHHIPIAQAATSGNLSRDHAARVGDFLRSLRDWPQPGRPA